MGAEGIKKVAVIGAGTMGHGIAQVFAMRGYEVWIKDIAQEILDRALKAITKSLEKLHKKGLLKEAPQDVLGRIHTTLDTKEACQNADFVIEAVPERLSLKKKIFEEVSKYSPKHAILATNTSSLSITEIAESTDRPDKVIGMHFFNPPVIMKLVEVIRGDKTSDETVEKVIELAKDLGKEPVLVKKDSPGFIVNRVLFAVFHEALWELYSGEYDMQSIDSAARFKAGLPMGVFELMDYIGLDINLEIFEAMQERGIPFKIPEQFKEKVSKKELGVKSGIGYYKYPAPGVFSKPSLSAKLGSKVDIIALISPAINEAAKLLHEDVASKEDIDKAVKLGLNWPMGVFEYADMFGIDNVVSALEELAKKRGNEFYKPSELLRNMVSEGKLGRKTGEGFYKYEVEREDKNTIKIIYEYPIAWIILSRPKKLNAVNMEMLKEIREAITKVKENDKIRSIVITGEGKAFSAGADVSEFVNMKGSDAFFYSRLIQGVFKEIQEIPKPVIAAIKGYALGGGLELAMACDIRIATNSATIGQPELSLGIIPGAAGTQRLVRLVGEGKAKELIFLGDLISAEEAEELGLINRVVPDRELELAARMIALRLADKPPVALAIAKYVITYGKDIAEDAAKLLEALGFGLSRSTEDSEEGIKAFLEKRQPKFKGR